MNKEDFSTSRLRAADSKATFSDLLRTVTLRISRRNHFLKGPVPLAWLVQAGRQSGLALHVGIWLWYRCGLTRSSKILFNAAELARVLGTSHRSVSRGLTALEAAGLISRERRPGRKTLVTLLKASENTFPIESEVPNDANSGVDQGYE